MKEDTTWDFLWVAKRHSNYGYEPTQRIGITLGGQGEGRRGIDRWGMLQ